MAIMIECHYAKKLGLPGYSSHNYSVTVRTEIGDLSQLERTNAELYGLLQHAVDGQIQRPGYVPGEKPLVTTPQTFHGMWHCTPKQQELILKLIDDHHLDKVEIEQMAQDRFGKGVKQLNKQETSKLIEDLFQLTGPKPTRHHRRTLPQGSRE